MVILDISFSSVVPHGFQIPAYSFPCLAFLPLEFADIRIIAVESKGIGSEFKCCAFDNILQSLSLAP